MQKIFVCLLATIIVPFTLWPAAMIPQAEKTSEKYPERALDTRRIGVLADSLIKADNVPSYSVGVVLGDSLVYSASFGVMNRETREPATPQTIYQIGSITKVFTATLLGALRDDGLVNLDDSVREYLPSSQAFPRAQDGTVITLRHLATHTSGLPRDFVNRVNVDPPGGPGVAKAYSTAELYEGLNQTEISGQVGKYAYSNMNFGLVGHLLERAAEVPYEKLLQRRILEPLGMFDTFVHVPDRKRSRFATPYWPDFGPTIPRDPWFFGEISGGGGLASTVPDLARFISFQFKTSDENQRPIAGTTVRELWTPQVKIDNRAAVGLGWHIREIGGAGKWVLHGGEVDGFSSLLAFRPDDEVGIIVLTNFGRRTASNLATRLMKIVHDWIDSKH